MNEKIDGISLSFKNGDEESLWIYSHTKGKTILALAKEFMDGLFEENEKYEGRGFPRYGLFDKRTINYLVSMFVEYIVYCSNLHFTIYVSNAHNGNYSNAEHYTFNFDTRMWEGPQ